MRRSGERRVSTSRKSSSRSWSSCWQNEKEDDVKEDRNGRLKDGRTGFVEIDMHRAIVMRKDTKVVERRMSIRWFLRNPHGLIETPNTPPKGRRQ